jgi:rfaE bifunctional protein kinase chain/domain
VKAVSESFTRAIKDFSSKKILVVGDVMLDTYFYGGVARISPEAPVPVLKKSREESFPGGAANVARNIVSLGGKAILIGVVGDDVENKVLSHLLAKEKVVFHPAIDESRRTTSKKRFVSDFHQMLRVDEEETHPVEGKIQDSIIAIFKSELYGCDAVIFSDYGKGFFSNGLSEKLINLAKEKNIQTFADFKPNNKKLFKGVGVIKINSKEAAKCTGVGEMEVAGQLLTEEFDSDVVITCGADGLMTFSKDGEMSMVSGKEVKLFDVSGAGDTIIAALTLAMTCGLPLSQAAELANAAGSIVVQKPGTSIVHADELSSIFSLESIQTIKEVPKLWGYEKWIVNNDKYCCKQLVLKKGYQCSLHCHNVKDETFLISKGTVRLEVGDDVKILREGNFLRILPGTFHRFTGLEDSVIIEVSTFHDDADVVRKEESRKVDID